MNYYYFEGADPTDLTQLESDYMKKLVVQKTTNPNTVQNSVFVSPKIDGYRAILYHHVVLKTHRTKEDLTYDSSSFYFITRRGEVQNVTINVPISLKETPFIFDVEIVGNKYFIMDVLHLNQEALQNVNFEYRLQKLNELQLEMSPDDFDNVQFIKVPFQPYDPTKKLTDITNLVSVKTDGVVFCFGKDWVRQSRKRFKLIDTIDFQILPLENSRDKVGLGVLLNLKPLQGQSRVVKTNVKQRFQQTIEIYAPFGLPQTIQCKKNELEINGIYEFKYNTEQQKFECIRRRRDKIKPNKLFVANFILNEIIKKKQFINPFQPNEDNDDSESSSESHSSKPLSM